VSCMYNANHAHTARSSQGASVAAWTPLVALSTPSRLVTPLSNGCDQRVRARDQRIPVTMCDGVLGD